MNNKPHDCRYTTATLLDKSNANKLSIKKILEHEENDMTKGTYTRKTLEVILETINLLK